MPKILRKTVIDTFTCGATMEQLPTTNGVFVNNIPIAVMGDTAKHPTGESTPVFTASATVFAGGIGVARALTGKFPGDQINTHLITIIPPIPEGPSNAITGSPDVFADEGINAALFVSTIEEQQLAEFEIAEDYREYVPEVNEGASYLLAATTFTDDEDSDNSQGLFVYPPPPANVVPPPRYQIMSRSIGGTQEPVTIEIAPPVTNPPPAEIPADNDDIFSHVGPFSGDFQLSPHVKLKDVTTNTAVSNYAVRAQANLTEQQIVFNLRQVALNIIERLYDLYPDHTWRINSGFRHLALTDTGRVSQHCKGQAVDIEFLTEPQEEGPNIKMTKDSKYIFARDFLLKDIGYDQFIFETRGGPSTWYHFSYNASQNRRIVNTSSKPGSYPSGLHRIA